jgi:AcrR family transcriptional regulator
MGRKSLAKERRAQITEAFYRCALRDGLQKASTRQIAKEAGVQLSTLHHYFKDRDEMVEELVKDLVNKTAARYLARISRYKNPATRFNRSIEFLFGPEMINDENAVFFYNCWAEAKRNKRVRKSLTMLYLRFRETIVDLLVETNKSSGLSAAEMKELACMVVAIQDGVSVQWDMDRANVSLKKISRLTNRVIDMYIEESKRIKNRRGKHL